ncbi:unnamed protein product [Acanthosepion pharaonis]|uniref:Uncharacterized protein n=1 Tax=Acanthosepion pharaonis TaxID=158019 RepID=A0A812BDR6_ACAPH|nr:unnamed protein product [Sepia pharaonis]
MEDFRFFFQFLLFHFPLYSCSSSFLIFNLFPHSPHFILRPRVSQTFFSFSHTFFFILVHRSPPLCCPQSPLCCPPFLPLLLSPFPPSFAVPLSPSPLFPLFAVPFSPSFAVPFPPPFCPPFSPLCCPRSPFLPLFAVLGPPFSPSLFSFFHLAYFHISISIFYFISFLNHFSFLTS